MIDTDDYVLEDFFRPDFYRPLRKKDEWVQRRLAEIEHLHEDSIILEHLDSFHTIAEETVLSMFDFLTLKERSAALPSEINITDTCFRIKRLTEKNLEALYPLTFLGDKHDIKAILSVIEYIYNSYSDLFYPKGKNKDLVNDAFSDDRPTTEKISSEEIDNFITKIKLSLSEYEILIDSIKVQSHLTSGDELDTTLVLILFTAGIITNKTPPYKCTSARKLVNQVKDYFEKNLKQEPPPLEYYTLHFRKKDGSKYSKASFNNYNIST